MTMLSCSFKIAAALPRPSLLLALGRLAWSWLAHGESYPVEEFTMSVMTEREIRQSIGPEPGRLW